MYFNVLIDVASEPGRLTRLEKYFREKGFKTRILTAETLRLTYRSSLESLDRVVREIVSSLNEVSQYIRTLCIEAWINTQAVKSSARTMVVGSGDNIAQVRIGPRGAVIKAVWSKVLPSTSILPGTALRRCLEPLDVSSLEEEILGKARAIESIAKSITQLNISSEKTRSNPA